MARTQQAAQANITLQEQIEAIHKAKGLVPEEDGKDKIGPSKPNEISQQSQSSASTMSSSAPPITSVPRPLPPVSMHQHMNPPVSRPPSVSFYLFIFFYYIFLRMLVLKIETEKMGHCS